MTIMATVFSLANRCDSNGVMTGLIKDDQLRDMPL